MITRERFIRTDKKDSISGSVMHTYQHFSGINITVIPKPGFTHKFAAFVVPYGSVHTRFRDGSAPHQIIEVPAGTAHYLEHCVFSRDEEGENGLLNRLAALGADANAYTTYTHTMYYLTSVDHFGEAMRLYFTSLLEPCLDEKRVEAEREIIQAEINMYCDDPDVVAYDRLMKNMFVRHGVREDIAGTAESISQITADHLQAVHRNFYNPASISLVLAGDFEDKFLSGLLDHIDNSFQADGEHCAGQPVGNLEPKEVACYSDNVIAEIAAESFHLGYKDPVVTVRNISSGANLMMRRIAGQLLLETIIGPSSSLYEELYAQGIINDSFAFEYVRETDCSYVLISGESQHPAAAAEVIHHRLVKALQEDEIDRKLFDVQKRVVTGQFLRSMDSVESAGMTAAICRLSNIDLFDYSGSFERIDIDDTIDHMSFILDHDVAARVILQNEEKE